MPEVSAQTETDPETSTRRQSAINETALEINKAENVNHLKRQNSSANIAIPIIQTSPPPIVQPMPTLPLTLPSLPMVPNPASQTHKYSITSITENKSTNKMNIKTNYCIENDEISTGIENSGNVEVADNLLKLTRRTMPNPVQSRRNNHLNKCNRQSICKLIDHAHYPKHHHPYDGTLTMNEQIDEYLNQCIEIESNRKLFQANVNWFLLNFRSKEYESMVL